MEVIAGGRQSGKTIALITRAASYTAGPAYIVCGSRDEAKRIERMARKMGADIPMPITFSEAMEARNKMWPSCAFFVDNVECFAQYILEGRIECLTIGYDERNSNDPA